MLQELFKEVKAAYRMERAEHSRGFFKTGPGEYGEGDVFYGLSVPEQRRLAKKYRDLSYADLQTLLDSDVHEHRLIAGLILVGRFREEPDRVYRIYAKNAARFNNWDLVDLTAPGIVGAYLRNRGRKPLYAYARSGNLWKRRIAIVATHAFIREGDFADALQIARMLLTDTHDLIHKAVGWMLREVGKRDEEALKAFLKRHCARIPRTTLRYAIERFPEEERKRFLGGQC